MVGVNRFALFLQSGAGAPEVILRAAPQQAPENLALRLTHDSEGPHSFKPWNVVVATHNAPSRFL
jgi:hypothetical protein